MEETNKIEYEYNVYHDKISGVDFIDIEYYIMNHKMDDELKEFIEINTDDFINNIKLDMSELIDVVSRIESASNEIERCADIMIMRDIQRELNRYYERFDLVRSDCFYMELIDDNRSIYDIYDEVKSDKKKYPLDDLLELRYELDRPC